MGSLLLVGAAVASTALQKAGLLSQGVTKGSSRSSPASGARRSRSDRPPLPQPILATTPRGYHDTKVKTPRGTTPRSVRFSDDHGEEDSPVVQRALCPPSLLPTREYNKPARTPDSSTASDGSSAAGTASGGSGRGSSREAPRTATGQALPMAVAPMGRAAGAVAKLPVQLAVALFDAVHSTGMAGATAFPFRQRQHTREMKRRSPIKSPRKSPRTPIRSGPIRTQTPVSPSGSVNSSSSGGSKPGRGSVDIPRLSLADKGVGGGEGGKLSKSDMRSPARSPARSPGHSPSSSTRNSIDTLSTSEAGIPLRRNRNRPPLRRGPLGVFGGNKVAARCEAAEADADALEAANEKLLSALRDTQKKLATAVTAGQDTKIAATLESSRRATALSEANKQLERLESKLKQRQAAVDELVTPRSTVTPRSHNTSPRVGSATIPPSPHAAAASSPRMALQPRFAFKSPGGGEGKDLWPTSSPRRAASIQPPLVGTQTPRTLAAAATAERRIAELRAKLTAQQTRSDEAFCRMDELNASLAERDSELAGLKAKASDSLSQTQLASTADLKRQLAAERHRAADQAQLVKHLQESLGAEGERMTDLQHQLADCHSAMETFDEQAQAQVAYVADLQDMCEELQSMQATMTHKNSASTRQASSLQEQLNVSLGVIKRLEQTAAEARDEATAECSALEAALEDARTLNDEIHRRLQQSQLAVQLAESDRDEALAALQGAESGGGNGHVVAKADDANQEDARHDAHGADGEGEDDNASVEEGSSGGASSRQSAKMQSARELLYVKQISELEDEVATMRKQTRVSKGAEADTSAAVQHLEARLATVSIDHSQDVRRLSDTIQGLEEQLREARRQASRGPRGASFDRYPFAEDDAKASEQQGPPVSNQGGLGPQINADEDNTSGSPRANRLLALTKRLEDVMGVSLQRTTGSHNRMSQENRTTDKQSFPVGRTALIGHQKPPIAEKPPKRIASLKATQERITTGTPPRSPTAASSLRPVSKGEVESLFGKPPRLGSLDFEGPGQESAVAPEDGSMALGPASPSASGSLSTDFGNIISQFPIGARSSIERSRGSNGSSAIPPRQSLERLNSNASLAGASLDFVVPSGDFTITPALSRPLPSPRRSLSESVAGSSCGGSVLSDTSIDSSTESSGDTSAGEESPDSVTSASSIAETKEQEACAKEQMPPAAPAKKEVVKRLDLAASGEFRPNTPEIQNAQ